MYLQLLFCVLCNYMYNSLELNFPLNLYENHKRTDVNEIQLFHEIKHL